MTWNKINENVTYDKKKRNLFIRVDSGIYIYMI